MRFNFIFLKTLGVITFLFYSSVCISLENYGISFSSKPKLGANFGVFNDGSLQHVDRDYKYDIVPDKLKSLILFKSVHELKRNTKMVFKSDKPINAYVILCNNHDKAITELVKTETIWEQQDKFPQYDIYNGKHGWYTRVYKSSVRKDLFNFEISVDGLCLNFLFDKKNKL